MPIDLRTRFSATFLALWAAGLAYPSPETLDSAYRSLAPAAAELPHESVGVDQEERAFAGALACLEFFMRAGAEADLRRGSELLASYYVNENRAVGETRRLFREQEAVLSEYVSVSNDVYGYELRSNQVGLWLDIEGGVETRAGITAEFAARLVFRGGRWLIWSLAID